MNTLFSALCWTLLHSLWQGVIAAVLAGIVIISTRKSPALVRYNLLGAIMILFLIAAGITFYIQLNHTTAINPANLAYQPNVTGNYIAGNNVATTPSTSLIDSAVLYLNKYSNLIVFIWFFVFAVKNIKLAADLWWIHRIRNHKTHSPTGEWQGKVNDLANTLGIRKAVALLQSELVKIPVTVGSLKPVILLPLGLLANLPPDQVETIILHELAHIRRKDYLINILQTFAESVFFFNPFILWISSVLRDEREACCDDMVIDFTRHKKSYIEALVSFQEYSLSSAAYAMTLGRRKSSMLDRVKRLLTSENKKLNNMEKLILLAGITVLTAFSMIPQKKTTAHAPRTEQQLKVVSNTRDVLDTLPKSKLSNMDYKSLQFRKIMIYPSNDPRNSENQTITATDQNGKQYKFEKLQGKIAAIFIDGVAVPANQLENLNPLYKKIESTLQEARMAKAAKKDYSDYHQVKQAKPGEQFPADTKLNGFDKKQYLSQELEGKGTNASHQPVKKITGASENDLKKEHPKNSGDKKVPAAEGIEHDQARVMDVLNTLVEEKVVVDPSAVDWFGLTENELVVNGIRQDASLHKKLKERNGIKTNYGLFYGPSKLGGVGIYLDKGDMSSARPLTY